MYDECNSLTARHKITLDRLTLIDFYKFNQSNAQGDPQENGEINMKEILRKKSN